MPWYDMKCSECGEEMEVHKARCTDYTPVPCPECDGEMAIQILTPAAVSFNGTGFYQTDYKAANV